ncbi:type II toxin-antitoxin system VapC family toxin [Lutibaculum baratangense]|uniref:Ribonuclease VapC n=1 Tax=Lutibaculum baratangense AMV1 TaxID=631454 RepID=V4RM99_9HYPH|nr:type II toxin-antitoxin system VapC family toxin [Lutibaculum baratangense]ESR26389.1 PilT protein domain protein [Lutibaculum baratangense AMV1]
MVILDTNVLSELMRPVPEQVVAAWADSQPRRSLYTATIVQAEILAGVATLPKGQRRQLLEQRVRAIFDEVLSDRVLPISEGAAKCYAQIYAVRRDLGRPISMPDGFIAAVAMEHGATIATRDTGGFEGLGLQLINPWRA